MDVQELFDQPLEERYRLDELIADKKYIQTYVAYDLQMDQIIAVDILKREFVAMEPFASEYHKRMQIWAKICIRV